MTLTALAFYVFASVAVASGLFVVLARNPVHSVLWLILSFFSAAGLMVLLGAEFVAMILIIVYVGAVAVLFLFVVMMLDISFAEMRQGFLQYLPLGALVGVVLLAELLMVGGTWLAGPAIESARAFPTPAAPVTNTEAIGHVLYTDYIYLFQAAGVVLLVAMIGAIVLTLRAREGVRRQRIGGQLARRAEESVELRKVQPGSGV